ncbi:DUF4382 domain-containing protein [Aliidiomarina sp.]|uniref:DUF4382 domain-containing protein n=1 Tax=Aliidiomarina sp. TaxID=1872439 RepID=UPI003A4D677F
MKRIHQTIALSAISLGLLSACNSSSDDTAQFSLAVSDAPVEQANVVMVCFESVELVGNGDQPQRFVIGESENAVAANDLCLDDTGNPIPNTRGVDLLTLQGAEAEALIESAPVPAGSYGQLRLDIAPNGSYVEDINGDTRPLRVPSNQLRLDGVTLAANQAFIYTLEFDLRKALVAPPGLPHYQLKPRGLRLVDNAEIGHVEGFVSETLLLENGCNVPPENADDPVAAVYFYSGHDLELDSLTDNSDDENGPYASVSVKFDGAGSYPFSLGYLHAGDYFAAVTCDTDDDPEEETDLTFFYGENITIDVNSTLEITLGE